MKRFISLILAIIMVAAMVPGMALAAVEPAPIEYDISTNALTEAAKATKYDNNTLGLVSWLAKGSAEAATLDVPAKTAAYQMTNRIGSMKDNSPTLLEKGFSSQFVVDAWSDVGGTPTFSNHADHSNYTKGLIVYGVRLKVPAGKYTLSLKNDFAIGDVANTFKSNGAFTKGAVTKVYFGKAETNASSSSEAFSAAKAVVSDDNYLGWYSSMDLSQTTSYAKELTVSEDGEYFVTFVADADSLTKNSDCYFRDTGWAFQQFYLSGITLTPILPARELSYIIGTNALTSTACVDYNIEKFAYNNMCYVSWLPKISSVENAALDPVKTDGYELYLRQNTSYQSGLDLRENALESAFIVGKNTEVGSAEISEYNNFKIPIRINVPQDGTYKLSLINDYPFGDINKIYKEGNTETGEFTKGAYVKVHLAKALENTPSGSYHSAANAVLYADNALAVKDYSNNWWYDVTKLGEVQQYDDELKLEAGEYFVVFEACEEGTKKNAVYPHSSYNYVTQMFWLSGITLTPVEEAPAESEEETAMKEAPAEEVEEDLSETAVVKVVGINAENSADTGLSGAVQNISASRGDDVEVTASTVEGYEFLYWGKGLGTEHSIVSTDPTYTVKATSGGTWLYAYYKKTDSTAVSVLFLDSNGDEITKSMVESGSEIEAPATPSAPGAPQFLGWKMPGDENTYSAEEVAELTATGDKMVFVAQFAPAEEKADITVTENGTPHAKNYYYGEPVSVTADATSGTKNFAYWKKGDEVVSFDRNYTFRAWESCTLTAVYLDTVPDAGTLRKIIIKGNVAEFIGLDTGVAEKGIIFRDTDATAVTLGNATHKIAMTTTGNHLSFNNDLTGNGATNFMGYAILTNGNVIYDK